MNYEKTKKNSSSQFLKTDGGKTKSNAIEVPSVALPKGGGSIKGIDEKFTVNAVNGTASFSIPLPFSNARGASPALDLSYNSGAGNGAFGLGWYLNLPSIKRKTDKELPQYFDDTDSDTFLFSGAEDLVPEFKKDDTGFIMDEDGNYEYNEDPLKSPDYTIRFYRPRIEGLFARIERWTHKTSREIKWMVTTKDNVTTLFGWSEASRIHDPEDPERIFEWLPKFVFDDKGNCSQYIYKKEDGTGFDDTLLCNRNRLEGGKITYTNLYPERVLYGNKTPYYNKYNGPYPLKSDYMFQTVFDYGEYETDAPYSKNSSWSIRGDAFSDYKAGFEIRTLRLCKRVLLFHCFPEPLIPGGQALVKSMNFQYDTSAQEGFTFLKSITVFGYIKKTGNSYTSKNLPPIEFEYQKHEWSREVISLSSEDLVDAPYGIDEQQYELTDLFNEGIPGILKKQAGGLFYKHNLGNGKFQKAKMVSPRPSFVGSGKQLQLMDLDGDGGKQLVSFTTEPKGYFELTDEEEWQAFRPFKNFPDLNMQDKYVRIIDLNGDGKPDVLITEDNVFTWYESAGRNGFEDVHKTVNPIDEEKGPHIVFADLKQTIFLADMSGDGMTDIVRIRNGEVCYWPNLGYGRFGAKVAMDNAPVFDYPDLFNPAYLRLADIDGSGTADIIYLGKNKFTCWMNMSGNSFITSPFEIESFPEVHSSAKVTVADFLGKGVSCIVWSSNLSKDAHTPLRYIDLMKGRKPHVMISYKNNFGKEVSLKYTPSTEFYIEDKNTGKPWVTKLHFPVQCISRIETRDTVSGYLFVNTYKYHHGYYDHAEREFRGFGMVEQWDSEHFDHYVKGDACKIVDKELHQEPVVTKTWVHTGAFLGREKILDQFEDDYWYKEMERQGFHVVSHEKALRSQGLIAEPGTDLSAEEWREALRACKGMALRSEVFAKDAPLSEATHEEIKKQLTPYSAASYNYVIELLQPRGRNRHAVFFVRESEAITYSYERNTEDPRITHSLNIKFDEYGNILESASAAYPRLAQDMSLPAETRQAQNSTTIIFTQNVFTDDVTDGDKYRLRIPCEVKTFELKGVTKTGAYYSMEDFDDIISVSGTALYHETDKEPAPGVSQKRLIEHIQTLFYNEELTGCSALGKLNSQGLVYESYQLAYTPELLDDIFGTRANEALMKEGKFTKVESDDNWWIRSGVMKYIDSDGGETAADAQGRFSLPVSYIDPYGSETKVRYDDYLLFIKETEDPLGNRTKVDHFNYRTLSPQRMSDINNNISEAVIDELGLVKAMAVFGKGDEADDLDGIPEYTTSEEKTMTADFFSTTEDSDQLASIGKNLLQYATARFIYDFETKPVVVASILREEHYRKNDDSPVQISFEYSNGLGQVVMKKVQAEPGKAKKAAVTSEGAITVEEIDTAPHLRWIGTGRTVLNNKGNVVKQYEPYFSATPEYEDLKELVETGVTPIFYYDAPGRLIKADFPDKTFSRTEFDSWKQSIYDRNDTILESSWYIGRINGFMDEELLNNGKNPAREKQAAEKAAKHANTPDVQYFDTLGRVILSIDHNKNPDTDEDEFYLTKVNLDIEGNLRSVFDARNNPVMKYKYDMLGNKVYQKSMDAGQRWLLTNVLGNPLCTWDERNHEFRYYYDELHRPAYSIVSGGDGDTPLDNVFERIFYGEKEPDPEQTNLRGRIIRHYHTGGMTYTPEYDFKGQPSQATQILLKNYKAVANWKDSNLSVDLETDSFAFITETDAIGRITQQIMPDGRVIIPHYNEGGLLNSQDVANADTGITTYIKNIDYNEKGQRTKIIYGNDVSSEFYYDKETFRLNRLKSGRGNGDPLQDLYYTFDPVGNITHMEDKCIPAVFFNNQKITGASAYTYDALYRLVEATGRENSSIFSFDAKDNWQDTPFMHRLNPGDPMAVRNYSEKYRYDSTGNILKMQHNAAGNDWTRIYDYQTTNNRLISTQVGANIYEYPHNPLHGFMTSMPHLEEIDWNFKEEIVKTIRQKRTDGGTPETTYYQYDGQGQRIRKITENQADAGINPTRKEERIYLGGYEVYKKHTGKDKGLERISLSLMDHQQRFVMIETRNEVDDGTEKHLVRYQLGNHLGSVSLELDGTSDAKVISYEEYHPYGTTAYQARNTAIKAADKRYRYTGKERDEESGLYYYGARYYSAWLGRWENCDPMGLTEGSNFYNYVSCNPIGLIDPDGMQPRPPVPVPGQTPYNFVSESPALSNWQKAMNDVLEPRFKGGSIEKNLSGFEKYVESLPKGSGKTPGTQSNYARNVFNQVRSRFYTLEAGNPSFNYSKREIQRLKMGHAPRKGFQIHHVEHIAQRPSQAIRGGNLIFTQAGPKGGLTPGTGHHRLHYSPGARRLAQFQLRRVSMTPPVRTAPSPKATPIPRGVAPSGTTPPVQLKGAPERPLNIPGQRFNMRIGGGGGMAGSLLQILIQPSIDNFIDFVKGGLRIDPEARMRFSDVLHITREDQARADAAKTQREFNEYVTKVSVQYGISEDEVRRRMEEGARSGPSYPTIGPAR